MSVSMTALLLLASFGQMGEEFHQDFRTDSELHPTLSLFGPNAFEAVQQGAEGLQITLPSGRADVGAVGVQPKFRMSGDFEITVLYEMGDVEPPGSGIGSGVKIWGKIASTPPQMTTLAHLVSPTNEARWVSIFAPEGPGKNLQFRDQRLPPDLKTGRLRLIRTGNVLSFQMAAGKEEGPFQELYRTDVKPDDVEVVRIQANTHGASSGVGLRLLKLTVRADRLLGMVEEEVEDVWVWVVSWVLVLSLLGAGGFFLYSRRALSSDSDV